MRRPTSQDWNVLSLSRQPASQKRKRALGAVHGVAKSWTQLSNFTFTFHFHALEKEMVTHSSVLAWRILGMGEPSELPSMGSHRVRHDWSDSAAAAAAVAHKRYSIQMNYYPCCDSWGRKESDTTERLNWTELSMCSSSSTGLVLWGSQHIFGESQGSVPDNNVHYSLSTKGFNTEH